MIDRHIQNKQNIDRDSLVIYNLLMRAFQKCENYSVGYKNLIGIFFHDLLRILTSLVYKIHETKNGLIIPELKNKKVTNFPYIDYNDIDSSENHKDIDTTTVYKNYLDYNLKTILTKNIVNLFSKESTRIAFTGNSLNYFKIMKMFQKNRFHVSYPNISTIYIEKYDLQFDIMVKYLREILVNINFDNFNLIQNIIKSHIENFVGRD